MLRKSIDLKLGATEEQSEVDATQTGVTSCPISYATDKTLTFWVEVVPKKANQFSISVYTMV